MPSEDRIKMYSLSWVLQKYIGLLVVKDQPPHFSCSDPTEKKRGCFTARGPRDPGVLCDAPEILRSQLLPSAGMLEVW